MKNQFLMESSDWQVEKCLPKTPHLTKMFWCSARQIYEENIFFLNLVIKQNVKSQKQFRYELYISLLQSQKMTPEVCSLSPQVSGWTTDPP